MAKAKNERNKQFIRAWKEGSSDKQLQKRFGLSEGGVKGLKARLRAKDPSLYTGKKPVISKTATSTTTQTQTQTSTKRMTFWLEKETIKTIKLKAKREGRTASDILRKILEKEL